jgi:serine/threonine protein phosphatase PrpC
MPSQAFGKHRLPAMFPAGNKTEDEQSTNHCFLVMYSDGAWQTRIVSAEKYIFLNW